MTARAARLLLLGLALAAAPAAAEQAPPATAESPDPAAGVRAVFDGLHLAEVVDLMTRESRATSEDLATTLFPSGRPPADWAAMLDRIYDAERLRAGVLADLEASLPAEHLDEMRAFLESDLGRRLMDLEVAAREAMTEPDAEAAAREAAAVALADDSPRLALLADYARVNDIVELNVAGTLNSNLAYVSALRDGGALGRDMTEGDLLTDVWGQEEQIRAGTTEWVYAFLLKAYEPASDEEIRALIDFSSTEAGQALNHAVFAAFDRQFREMSRGLGLAVAHVMTTEEI